MIVLGVIYLSICLVEGMVVLVVLVVVEMVGYILLCWHGGDGGGGDGMVLMHSGCGDGCEDCCKGD